MPDASSMFPFDIPKELYQSFLITYGTSSVGRMAVAAYKQLAVLQTAWYDVPTPVIAVLEQGFVQHALLSLAAAEVLNMVLGALYKNKVRREARDQALTEGRAEGRAEGITARDKAWREWLRRKTEAEANGQAFTEPAPDEQPRQ